MMIRFLALAVLLLTISAHAQIQIGTIKGGITDPAGAVVTGASVWLTNSITGEKVGGVTDGAGVFVFNNVSFNHYTLRVEARGFAPQSRQITVNSNLPLELSISLSVAGASEQINVTARENLVDPASASSATTLAANFIGRAPRVDRGLQLQELIATTPGMGTENNGLIHIRGVDDGALYVLDGIPITDRLDAVSASSFDTDTINTLQVITGNIPAEFGGRNGGVIIIQPKSGIDENVYGIVRAGLGDFGAGDVAAAFGASVGKKFGFFANAATNRSDRYLDPVDPRNFNNRGGAINLSLRADWHPNGAKPDRDTLLFNLSGNGANFRAPNDLLQEERGQRQRQELRDYSISASWQHLLSANTVINAAFFNRRHESELFGSEADVPIFARQDRAHTRSGLIASLTHQTGSRMGGVHTIKAGVEASRVAPREFFTFFITDGEVAEDREISDAALKHDRDDPFLFRDRRVRGQFSFYAQDQFSPLRNLTAQVGLRYDHTSLLVSDQQVSPRLGVVYFIPKTKTMLRASFNRLFQPPQVDNLLLSSSEMARSLSPFATGPSGGGADIHPEKVSAYEAGFAQDFRGWVRLDAAFWRRDFRNVGDPNVFFNTTIIFPNSVAKGFSRGVDVRLDAPERRGWSGWLSYTNMRILQTGPINGGLFLTGEFIEIGPGVRFIPDQDQRNTGAFGVIYQHHRSGLLLSFTGRHESGVPLEVEKDRLEELKSAPGAELVDFERGRVKPRTVFNFSAGVNLFKKEKVVCTAQLDILNIADKFFAYNFGNPFEGTHFGHGRRWSGGLRIEFR
ncbi:MAG TPA: TonB-dependent receptor [Blastocatellia bacterium]|nr:TonB-dependent receptor [Blastocatellia bacterium]